MISHERKLQLFERCPARWTSGVAPQPGLETFLMKTSHNVSQSFFRTEPVHLRVMTLWGQGPRLLLLELHETNTAVIHRHFHQTEFELHSPVFELSAPLNLDWSNEWKVGRVFRTIGRSCRARSFALSSKRKGFLCNVLLESCGE